MSKHKGLSVGIEVCKALGLDPENVHSVHINLDAGNVADIEIKRFLVTSEIGPILEVLKKYEIKPKND